ncbi:MAG TPA: putative zinc-binding metallopeptidase [Thermoanaerobaculia bacterium]|nr:putative zinc-binding metallopeptidase [Thermoanaerobaculia bacterium]
MQFEHAPPEARQLLPIPIRDLGLSLERSPVAELVRHLYAELEQNGLRHFRPMCYLSDEWGSPTGEPVIGIPFYLGDTRVANLEDAINDVEDEREIMMYLRHEAGHAFNHAYELYRTQEWRQLFGSTRKPYRDDYPFVPFSHDFVRYIPGWYAQKHPDEDFAETFAVWLDPTSLWESRYAGWGALRKLQYVDRIAHALGDMPPVKSVGQTDVTVAEMEQTVEEFYRQIHVDESPMIADLALDSDLTDIFPAAGEDEETRSAALLLREHRRTVIDKVNYWTGVRRTLVRTLVMTIEKRLAELELVAVRTRSRNQMVELTVYITTLAMTFLLGKKRLKHRRPTR